MSICRCDIVIPFVQRSSVHACRASCHPCASSHGKNAGEHQRPYSPVEDDGGRQRELVGAYSRDARALLALTTRAFKRPVHILHQTNHAVGWPRASCSDLISMPSMSVPLYVLFHSSFAERLISSIIVW